MVIWRIHTASRHLPHFWTAGRPKPSRGGESMVP
jgi:hypothetical protein